MLTRFREKFIGDRAFYKTIMGITIPIMIQNFISNFVSMLDNIMVGRVGTEQMSGVSIANQLFFVYYLCMFGGMGGVEIFTAQYFGKNDQEGVRDTFRYKLWMAVILSAVAAAVFLWKGAPLIGLYLQGSSDSGDLAATLQYGLGYLRIILLMFPAFLILQAYTSTLRGCGETVVPMKAGIAAVAVNLVFNWLLIFGHCGFPKLGVNGAAIATVLSRYVELAIVVIWTHTHTKVQEWAAGVYRKLTVPAAELKRFFLKGMPLMVNETLWSSAQAILTQCYSLRGLNVIVAFNIANTINSLANIVFLSMGDAVAIVVGQLLGAGRMEEAKDRDNKIIFFGLLFSLVTLSILCVAAPFFPGAYNTNEDAKHLASMIILAMAFFSPMNAFNHCAYFTLRSGGRTIITFFFDSAFNWAVSVPVAFVLSRFTAIPALWCFVLVCACDLIKCVIGFVMLKKNIWMQNIVSDQA